MSVQTVRPHLVHLVSCRIKSYAFVGHTLRSIPLRFLRLLTSCKFYAMSERHICSTTSGQKQVICSAPCLSVVFGCLRFVLPVVQWSVIFLSFAQSVQSPFCSCMPYLTTEAPDTSSASTCSSLLTSLDPDGYDEHKMWNLMLGLFVMNTLAHSWSRTLMKLFWGESHILVTLRSIYCVTKLKFVVLNIAISPTLHLAMTSQAVL